jgi:hypothetical protein
MHSIRNHPQRKPPLDEIHPQLTKKQVKVLCFFLSRKKAPRSGKKPPAERKKKPPAERKKEKLFFFEKKKQKTFTY